MAATRRAAQGNSSTAKQLINAQEAGKSIKTAADVAGAMTGAPGALMNMMERGTNFASGLTPRVAAEVLDMAMAGGNTLAANAKAPVQIMGALNAATRRQLARQARQNAMFDAAMPVAGQIGGVSRPSSR